MINTKVSSSIINTIPTGVLEIYIEMRKFSIGDLNTSIPIYTDIVRNGKTSKFSGEIGWKCLEVLEYFEEYEKCGDILPHLTQKPDAPEESQNKHKNSSI